MNSDHRSAIFGLIAAMAATLVGVVAIEVVANLYPSVFWPSSLAAFVVYAVFASGITAGVTAAIISLLYSYYYFFNYGYLGDLDNSGGLSLIVMGAYILSILILTAILKQRAERKTDNSRKLIDDEVQHRIQYYESTIQASESRLRALMEHSFESVVVIDQKGVITYASPSIERVSGFKPEEIEGHNGFEFLHPEDIAATQKKLAQIVNQEGAIATTTYRSKLKAGGWYWAEVGAVNLLHNPAVRGIVINFRDITERRESEVRIQASEAKFRSLFENMSEGFALCEMIYDPQGKPIDFRYLEVNPAWENQTGIDREKVVGRTVREVIPGIEQFWIDTYAKVVETGQPAEFESSVKELNRWFEIHASRHSPGRFAVIFVDISERKQNEESLRARTVELALEKTKVEEEKAKVDTIISSIGDAVFAVDTAGRLVLLNQAAEQMTGYQAAESLGRYYSQVFKLATEQNPQETYPDFVQEVIKTGKPRSAALHTVLIRRDGSSISVSDLAAPFRDEKGGILGAVVVLRDNTRERALERAKDEFISVASHQLRTPLGSMRWTLELLLQDGSFGAELKQSLNQIYENNQRMISLVNDLLNVSRIDQGRVPEKSEMIHPEQIIQTTIQDLRQLAEKNQIQINLSAPPPVPEIWFDPDRFHEVIENLLSNAIKYSRTGGQVDISLAREGEKLRIIVADHGIGIPESEQSRVFQKFFRADNAVQSETEGSGLGLFVVKSYIEKWGGTTWFESQENEGTKFYIDLPLHSQDTEERKE